MIRRAGSAGEASKRARVGPDSYGGAVMRRCWRIMSPAVTGMRGLSMRLAPTTIRLPVVSLCRTVGCGSSSATMIRPRGSWPGPPS